MAKILAFLTARPRIYYVLAGVAALLVWLWWRKRPVTVTGVVELGEPTVSYRSPEPAIEDAPASSLDEAMSSTHGGNMADPWAADALVKRFQDQLDRELGT